MKADDKKEEMKTPKQRDTLDLLELVCQLHSRALAYPSKEMHDSYIEARTELENRIKAKSGYTEEEMRGKVKNIYTVLEEIQFEKKIKDFVELNKKGANLGVEESYVQQFVFGIVQQFRENEFQSLPPRNDREGLQSDSCLFAEFIGNHSFKMNLFTDDESKRGKWYRGDSSLLGKTKFYTTLELLNSPEFKKWKEERK